MARVTPYPQLLTVSMQSLKAPIEIARKENYESTKIGLSKTQDGLPKPLRPSSIPWIPCDTKKVSLKYRCMKLYTASPTASVQLPLHKCRLGKSWRHTKFAVRRNKFLLSQAESPNYGPEYEDSQHPKNHQQYSNHYLSFKSYHPFLDIPNPAGWIFPKKSNFFSTTEKHSSRFSIFNGIGSASPRKLPEAGKASLSWFKIII